MSKEIPHNGFPQSGKRVPRLLLAETESLKDELETLKIASAFCEAGYEVIYVGCQLTPEQIYSAALQEGVDLIGLNLISGVNGVSFQQVIKVFRERKAECIILNRNVLSNSEYFSRLQKYIDLVHSDTRFAMSA